MNMLIGALLLVAGLAVTLGSLADGGYVIVAYGAIIAGAGQFIFGLLRGEAGEAGKLRPIMFVPLAIFVVTAAFIAYGLYASAPRTIQSALIGQPLPEFSLAPGAADRPGLTSAAFRQGQPRVINIFASWCIPCRAEAGPLAELARRGVPIDGIAVRDRPEDLAAFLATYGNPFQAIGSDVDRRVQLNLGSAGVPETFVVDGRGIIRHQHIGAIMAEDVPRIVAAWEAAR